MKRCNTCSFQICGACIMTRPDGGAH
jgi:hypothetical protein